MCNDVRTGLHEQLQQRDVFLVRSLLLPSLCSAALSNEFPLPVFPINSPVSSAFPIYGDPAVSFLSWITGCVRLGPYVRVFVTYKSLLALRRASDSVSFCFTSLLLNIFWGRESFAEMQLWCSTFCWDFVSQKNTLQLSPYTWGKYLSTPTCQYITT